ncbi:unnamed protein product [Urochloa humidicola]
MPPSCLLHRPLDPPPSPYREGSNGTHVTLQASASALRYLKPPASSPVQTMPPHKALGIWSARLRGEPCRRLQAFPCGPIDSPRPASTKTTTSSPQPSGLGKISLQGAVSWVMGIGAVRSRRTVGILEIACGLAGSSRQIAICKMVTCTRDG